jgi:hypothetical protein
VSQKKSYTLSLLRTNTWLGKGVTAFLMLRGLDPFFGINAGFVALVLSFAVAGVLGIVLKGSRPVVPAGEET